MLYSGVYSHWKKLSFRKVVVEMITLRQNTPLMRKCTFSRLRKPTIQRFQESMKEAMGRLYQGYKLAQNLHNSMVNISHTLCSLHQDQDQFFIQQLVFLVKSTYLGISHFWRRANAWNVRFAVLLRWKFYPDQLVWCDQIWVFHFLAEQRHIKPFILETLECLQMRAVCDWRTKWQLIEHKQRR